MYGVVQKKGKQQSASFFRELLLKSCYQKPLCHHPKVFRIRPSLTFLFLIDISVDGSSSGCASVHKGHFRAWDRHFDNGCPVQNAPLLYTATASSTHLKIAHGQNCTLSTPSYPPLDSHPCASSPGAFTSRAHPLSTNVTLYPRKSSTYARLAVAWAAGCLPLHFPRITEGLCAKASYILLGHTRVDAGRYPYHTYIHQHQHHQVQSHSKVRYRPLHHEGTQAIYHIA
jgi:hypothetical protein